ncbi:MAG: site-2 protease family protein [Methanimicrococcus sp.]|nr:site-2 protease family protein [Methanimicrococcus sp.]
MQLTTQLFILAFFAYWAIIYFLKTRGILAKYNISAYGPILMIETDKGLHLLDKIALPKRFWRLFANIGIVLMFAGMIFMFSLVVFSDIALFKTALDGTVMEPNEFTEIQNVFLIPGVNDFIPFVWGLIALIIAVFIHEMMHSVLARVEDIRVHSVGLIVALFPIGGFAKIDDKQLYGDEFEALETETASEFNDLTATIEEIREHDRLTTQTSNNQSVFIAENETNTENEIKTEKENENKNKLKTATKTQRSRILAAGVMSNFVVALIAGLLFFGPVIGAMAPIGSLQIMETEDFSASSGLMKEMVLVGINGQNVTDITTVNKALENVTPGDSVTVTASYNREIQNYTIKTNASAENISYAGILIQSISPRSPAESAGIKQGSILYKIDGNYLFGANDFSSVMANKSPGDSVLLSVQLSDENGAVLKEDIAVTLDAHPDNSSKSYLGVSYQPAPLQINLLGITAGEFNAAGYLEYLKTLPKLLFSFDFSEPKESALTMIGVLLILVMMPFLSIFGDGFSGFSDSMMQFFEPIGWAEPLGIGIFWIANLLYWVAWLNFYVGLFNCLPAIPLDGGHLLRTYIVKIAEKLNMDSQKAVRLSFKISTYLTAFIFLSFILMFVWPYINSYILGLF